MTSRSLPVPDGLVGERLDAGLARLLGLSRSAVVELADAGRVRIDGREVSKSERLRPGSWLEIDLPDPADAAPAAPPEPVPGLLVVHDDDDLVVVDKPVGVAAHPSPGWTGPTVVGGLAAAGYRIATSGAAERQGVVHRLPRLAKVRSQLLSRATITGRCCAKPLPAWKRFHNENLLEVIIVDDGSSDAETIRILREVAEAGYGHVAQLPGERQLGTPGSD